ncbi:MAG: pyridoxamine 5'-phosphate oxidase [Proteobacteria bacterium]|nr:pyridoxamine 5'-phosphate oxidase [Pseudomonadota bacterium]
MGWGTDPTALLDLWLAEAHPTELRVSEAMQLATSTADGRPSIRTVLLKSHDAAGVVFFTNFLSRKAQELNANPHAALLFHFKGLERQVIVEGRVERVDASESDAYFESRPRGSQIGAWASHQSAETEGRAALLESVAEVEARFEGQEVPRPPHWGGYRVVPDRWEFWQGHESRLHERWALTRDGNGWVGGWLQP